LILDTDKRNVTTAGLTTTKMQVAVDAQTIKNLIANYSRPHESCIRELCVNAYEAHFLAGKPDEPFLVHMPTKLEPWFAIQDFGIGMSEDEIHELYSVIGKSSKRGSNDLTGAFGVGSKAAYAVTNIFTIQSSFNGKKFSYICHLDQDGIPCLSEAPNNGVSTSDPNGFTVKFDVPSNEYHRFIDGLKPALAHFKTKPIISGHSISWDKMDVAVQGPGYKIARPKNRYDNKQYTVVMGQIGYPIETYQLGYNRISNNFGFEIEVPIGAVDINSSRETLQYSEKTKDAIIKAYGAMMVDVETKIDSMIANEDCDWNKGIKSKTFYEMFGTKIRHPPAFDGRRKVKFRGFFNSSGLRLQPIKDLNEAGGIRFILDDLERGAIVRCEDLKKGMGDTVLIPADQEKQAVIDFGIKPEHIIKASSIKRQIAKRTPQQKNTQKIQRLRLTSTTRVTYCWENIDVNSLEKTALYCDMTRHSTTLNGKSLSPVELNQLIYFLNIYGVKTPTIYGVKKGGKPEPGWKPLESFLNKNIKKHLETYVKEINAPYIPSHEYTKMSEIFDLSAVRKTTRRNNVYGQLLQNWFTLPKPPVEKNTWKSVMEEVFFWDMFSHQLNKPKHREAFNLLCDKYVTSFPRLETK
jgi:hypothetical protein